MVIGRGGVPSLPTSTLQTCIFLMALVMFSLCYDARYPEVASKRVSGIFVLASLEAIFWVMC